MKRKILLAGITICVIFFVELFLTSYFGFCNAVLMEENSDYEYIAQPNQRRYRFRNNVFYNSLSMRSEEIDTTAIKILGFGDSIINGGVQTDHDSLATTILSKILSKTHKRKVQFLNISAGSWGPDNNFAYLKKHGDFGATSFFLFVSSHDAYDNMNFEKLVGNHVNYPNEQYNFALQELLLRYLIPKINKNYKKSDSKNSDLGINKKKDNSVFNTGFENFITYAKENNKSLTIYLHADLKEFNSNCYNKHGKKIIEFAQKNNIPIILDLNEGLEQSDFRDEIHINSKGQKKIVNTILKYINNFEPKTNGFLEK